MLKKGTAGLLPVVRLLYGAPLSRCFAATKSAVSMLTVPESLDGLRADRVLLALLQVHSRALFEFRSRSSFQNCQWSVIQRALGASCVRVRDGQSTEMGRRVAADERISGQLHGF
jgi:hypothetical protein